VNTAPRPDDDDVYFKNEYTQKCRPAKGIIKRINIQIIKDTDLWRHEDGDI
jgi:hypothetical protein